jgi:hypothetical protein
MLPSGLRLRPCRGETPVRIRSGGQPFGSELKKPMMQWMRRLGLTADTRRSALIFLFASFLLTALIGAGLDLLELKPGMPPPSLAEGGVGVASPEAAGVPIGAFVGILSLIIIGIFLLILIVQLVRGVEWRRLLSGLFSFFWKAVLVGSFFFLIATLLPKSQSPPEEAPPLPPPKPPVFAPLGRAPSILLWLVGIGILVLAIVLGAWMIAERRKPRADRWEKAAEQALRSLLDGEDVRKVILECYRQMSRALREERNIERESFMTAGEFERLLAAKGVPHSPVHRLTDLFEAVRYGRAEPTPSEERDAIQSLEAILSFSRAERAD